ncbi:hypothetical protein L1987_06028 [Smallanthus sonchifolius]|uniref:Uncharacterized protein n=1 Tax=Smallanthus sonchifolius TaxID=185202 RepID=A0ACB9JX03_9ASTR|nr:hypothetical protein L1987_06028 [Smallanthus sonchifolius]
MMCWWSENPYGDEFKHHLARVPDYLWIAEDGMKMQESQIKQNPSGDFSKMCRHFSKGAWTLSEQDQGWAVSDCTAEALKCLLLLSQMPEEISGEKVDNERLYEAVNVLLYLQSPISGGFSVWEPPIPQPYLEMLNPSEIFEDIVVEKEHVENTASVMQALLAFKRLHPRHREDEIEVSVAKAVCFLEEKQWHDGSYESEIVVLDAYAPYIDSLSADTLTIIVMHKMMENDYRSNSCGSAYAMCQLIVSKPLLTVMNYLKKSAHVLVEETVAITSFAGNYVIVKNMDEGLDKTYNNSEAVHKGVNFLLSKQNEEGGWGESTNSCRHEVYTPLDGNRTNLVQTSWAMLGLMLAGQVERVSGSNSHVYAISLC